MTEFKKQHSEIRYSAMQITDYLFDRSARFRDLLLEDFQAFFEYIFGIQSLIVCLISLALTLILLDLNINKPIPPPKKSANDLKKFSAITVKKWHDKFCQDYKILDLGFKYLKNCKKVRLEGRRRIKFVIEISFSRLILSILIISQLLKEEMRLKLIRRKKFN